MLAAVRSTRAVLDAETQRITAGLQVLAQSDALRARRPRDLPAHRQAFFAQFDGDTLLVLGDRDGRILFDSRGNPEPGDAGRAPRGRSTARCSRPGEPEYSELFIGALSKRLLLTITRAGDPRRGRGL